MCRGVFLLIEASCYIQMETPVLSHLLVLKFLSASQQMPFHTAPCILYKFQVSLENPVYHSDTVDHSDNPFLATFNIHKKFMIIKAKEGYREL